ncbi:hypothetical protein NLJ89_g9245 [Agrocybe chaxingu]|uniref:Condensin complex subunit 2 n=1 Tax=Agrocybe chaxingu TaxID=84603 RepID=A0A9W8JR58_9AGAR|nr:hypothetical protein NLJ89_g9245 [Agrocybe chaxingu]
MDVDDADKDDLEPTDPSESRQFSQVITGLNRTYPRDKMEEISTSFCFICLLHLANEQGLKLEAAVEDSPRESGMEVEDEFVSGDKKIGNIWDVKVRASGLSVGLEFLG